MVKERSHYKPSFTYSLVEILIREVKRLRFGVPQLLNSYAVCVSSLGGLNFDDPSDISEDFRVYVKELVFVL